jgi:CBS domain protein
VGPRELTGQQITLEDIMRPVISVRHDAPAQEALQVRLVNNVPGVPVVNASGYLVGFVDGGHLLASTLPTSVTIARNRPSVLEGADAWVRYDRAAADRPVEELMSREFPWVDIGQSEGVARGARSKHLEHARDVGRLGHVPHHARPGVTHG